jgi:hypothetical protein
VKYRHGLACWRGQVVEVAAAAGRWGTYWRNLFDSVNAHTCGLGGGEERTPEAWASCEGRRPS